MQTSNPSKNANDFEISTKNQKWTNRERVLVFCARGASFRDRHLMNNLKTLFPHAKSESKLDKSSGIRMINEIAQMKNCRKCLYFENRKRQDLYLWAANVEAGPSVKFLVHNVHTMEELRLSGNCLKGSRPVLSFDKDFDNQPHLQLIKQLFMQIFATPNHHPRSQPFIDHVFTFSLTSDGRIWFRNFQIVDDQEQLQEIGPRMVLEVIKIFAGSFEGSVLYENPEFESPNLLRRRLKTISSGKYANKQMAKKGAKTREKAAPVAFPGDPFDDLFDTSSKLYEKKSATLIRGLKMDGRRKKTKMDGRRKKIKMNRVESSDAV